MKIFLFIVIIVVLVGLIIAKTSYKLLLDFYFKNNKYSAYIGITANQVVKAILFSENINCNVIAKGKLLENAYSPKILTLYLSNDIINSKSVASIGIAMHEVGHAVQHKTQSKLFYFYNFCALINKITSILIWPLIIFFVVAFFSLSNSIVLITLFIILAIWLFSLFSRVCLILVEKNASKIAINLIKKYKILDKGEIKIAKKILNYALLTYIGAIFVNILKLIKNLKKFF